MTENNGSKGSPRAAMRRGLAAAISAAVLIGPSPTQNAVANGDTRTLTLFHAHTQENITVTFRRYSTYDRGALEKLNWFLRDWRKDEPTEMDPRLFDVVWATWREVGSSAPIRVVSAYRSPSTNAMLRRRSSAVAKQSQHMAGKAMDMHMPDVSMAKVREIGMRLQNGGVGYYPTAGTPFVHLDVGSVRSWPRMPRHQLERLFPDGKTVHLPADSGPLPGYEAALAQIQARGGSAVSFAEATSPRRSLWAALFGGEDEEVEVATPQRGRAAARGAGRRGAPPQVAALSAPSSTGDGGSVYAVGMPGSQPVAVAAPAPRIAPAPKPLPVDEPVTMLRTTTAEKPPEAPKPAAGPALSSLPLPPRRPSENIEPTPSALAEAHVPLPPVRPPMTALAELPQPTPQAAPAAEPAPKLASVPLPPVRPQEKALALAGAGGLDKSVLPAAITGQPSLGNSAAPVTAYAPGRTTPATARPTITAAITPAADRRTVGAPQVHPVKLDQTAMASLMSHVALAAEPARRPTKVALPSVRESVGAGIIAGRFDGEEKQAATGFSGSLTRPMAIGFVQRGQ